MSRTSEDLSVPGILGLQWDISATFIFTDEQYLPNNWIYGRLSEVVCWGGILLWLAHHERLIFAIVLRAFLPSGSLAGFHVPFSLWDLYSLAIDSCHFWGSLRTSLKVTGLSVFPIRMAKAFIPENS